VKIGILHTAFIGDVILSGLLVEGLWKAGHEIVYVTQKKTASLFQQDERVAKVLEIEKGKGLRKLAYFRSNVTLLQAEQFDVLLVPHRSATSTFLAAFSGAKIKLGFSNADFAFLYSKTVPFPRDQHECVRYLNFLLPEFCSSDIQSQVKVLARPVFRYPSHVHEQFEKEGAQQPLPQPHLNTSVAVASVLSSFFILAVGSVWGTKKYPIPQWVEVIFSFLQECPQLTCVLTGSHADRADALQFLSLFQTKCAQEHKQELLTRVIFALGAFSLVEFACLTDRAQCVVCNDSSPIHFAAAFNIPVCAVFGPTVAEFGFAPSSEKSILVSYSMQHGHRLACQPCSAHGQHACPKGHFSCMRDLDPGVIVKALRGLLF
jgi:heptosyltransferase-2